LTLTNGSSPDEIVSFPCVIGKGGCCPATEKSEGDGCTPLGVWPVRGALLRSDRVTHDAPLPLPWRWIGRNDGWSDDPADPAYNRPVTLPHAYSAEHLWRDDDAYDVIIVLGHNDAPPVPGSGSAIFFHVWVLGTDGAPKPTEGCVAIAPDAMRTLLPMLTGNTIMEIAG
jgi:L,D-peptidoglycan transpeptidase YkuD (ErfK/YbiS/YcfS/YnhG family)